MKKHFILIVGVLLFFSSFAEPVSLNSAEIVAKNLIFEKTSISQKSIIFDYVIVESKSSINLFYVFAYKNGFVIISADDKVLPILGYSNRNEFSENNLPTQLQLLLDFYANQIKFSIDNNLQTSIKTQQEWNKYLKNPIDFVFEKSEKIVDPLLGAMEWGQGEGWNSYCPTDAGGSGGHAYVGCIATAIGQIMKYYEYPTNGIGSHSYNHDIYGVLSANFAATTYNWQSMEDANPTNAAALLLYHIGVALEMDYGPSSSGADTKDSPYILADYFKYHSQGTFIRKENYTETNWINIIKNELDNQRPVFYAGTPESGGGHAFVIDGYDNSNFFNVNWGWEGIANGFFILSDLTPLSYNFNYNQVIAIGVKPDFSEPAEISANVTQQDVQISWKQPLYWNSYVDLCEGTNLSFGNYERAIFVDNTNFGFCYPALISAVSHTFYEHSSYLWDDATFKFKIYNTDGNELLYESSNIEARHREEVFHELTTPIEVSNDFYVAIDPISSSGHPSSRSVKVALGETHSYHGSAGDWDIFENTTDGYEMITGVYIAGSGLLKSKKTKILSRYEIYRNDNLIYSASASTFDYSDNGLSEGDYTYCAKAVYADGTSICSEHRTVHISSASIDENNIDIKIYPNPTNDFVFINNCKTEYYIDIFDVTGKKVLSKITNKEQNMIDLKNLQNGIYFMKISSNEFQKTLKIIKL